MTKLFSFYPARVRTVCTCGRLGKLPQHFSRFDSPELTMLFFCLSNSECASEIVTHSKPEQVILKVMRQEGEGGGFFGCVSHNCLQETTETCPSLGDVQSQHMSLAKWFLPVQQFCMSSNKELSSLPQPVQGESWELSQSVCKFISCPGIDCLALVCFKMLLLDKQGLRIEGLQVLHPLPVPFPAFHNRDMALPVHTGWKLNVLFQINVTILDGFCLHKVVRSLLNWALRFYTSGIHYMLCPHGKSA